MAGITTYSIKNYMAIYALIFIVVVVGLNSYITLPREANPDISIPFVIVTTTYQGVAPTDIESLVTQEIEKELKNINNIKEMRSSSKEGVSAITVEFDPSVDLDEAVQKVRDKVNTAKPKLPPDADEPVISEINFSNIPIMIVNVSGEYGLVRLKKVAEELQNKVEQVAGVLKVTLAGGLEREVKVDVDPERLLYYNLSLQDVVDVIKDENVTIPGGSIDIGNYKYLIRVPGEFDDPMIIKELVLKSNNLKPVYIRDVADVSFGYKRASSFARLNGVEGVSLSVTKRTGENIIKVSDEIKKLLKLEQPSLPRTTKVRITADQSEMTRTLLNDLENNIISGLILVLIVLFFFLGIKVAVFVALSIPFSMLISFFVLQVVGFSLNMVVLFSLILALGMLVDNAIVIVENIYRHAEEGTPPFEAAMKGTAEVAKPVIISTVTTLCAFFPMVFWPGIMGEFMVYLPYTISITLTSSLFVAMVINPTLCATLLHVKAHGKKMNELNEKELGFLKSQYKRFLQIALKRRGLTFGLAIISLVLVMMVYGVLGHGVEFFPDVEPSKAFVDIEAPAGTNLKASDLFAQVMEGFIKKRDDIETYVTNVGVSTSQFDFGGMGEAGPSHKSRIALDFIDREDRTRPTYDSIDKLRQNAKKIIGANVMIDGEHMGPPSGPPINVELSGPDYDLLSGLSLQVAETLKKIPGLVDLESDYSAGRPEISVTIDREQAAKYGFSTKDIANVIRTAIHGQKASTFRQSKDEYDIRVRLQLNRRDRIEKLKSLFIKHEGNLAPLSSFAKITTSSGYGDIAHIDQKRVITVSTKLASGINQNAMLATVKEKLTEKIALPEGYRMAYTGQDKEQQESEEFLTKAFIGALLLIAFVLILEFNSFATPLIILSSVVLSMIGVVIGLMVTVTPFGVIMTGVGVISLAGVVVNNSIVLLDYTILLRERGMGKYNAIVTAGMTRLRPVLLTAITTILGLMPMAVGISFDFKKFSLITQSDSSEWWGPMAVAIIFGLGFATVLTLVVVPTLYSLLDSMASRLLGTSLTNESPLDKDHTG
ncbi:Acriflavin resistance protein [hydrothermal vent metagenome]|uniref:Acriflavin resistance protein n=1 Tax=hydrothermal vent metagenome TaxID=652676 RepID=A0A3B1C265_9ZZZZ